MKRLTSKRLFKFTEPPKKGQNDFRAGHAWLNHCVDSVWTEVGCGSCELGTRWRAAVTQITLFVFHTVCLAWVMNHIALIRIFMLVGLQPNVGFLINKLHYWCVLKEKRYSENQWWLSFWTAVHLFFYSFICLFVWLFMHQLFNQAMSLFIIPWPSWIL